MFLTGKKTWLPTFSPFPMMFSKGLFLRVVKSRDCLVELNRFNLLPNDKILDSSKLKAFVDDKINASEKLKFCWEGKKILWEKEKMLLSSIFSFSPQFFQTASFSRSLKVTKVTFIMGKI